MKVKKPRANPLKIITPMPKCLSWCNYEKSLFQSYEAVFMTQNHVKRHFFGINFGVKSYLQICA
jgi:hypothetical protein